MSVSGVQNSANDNSAYGGVADNGGSDLNGLFLQLLVAQIQNQDPLNPTDGTEYVSQLAQMSQVQSMENMSSMMSQNSTLIDNLQVLSTAGLVGKSVMVQTNKIEVSDQTVEGRLTLAHAANTVTVSIKDASGKETSLELGAQEAGQVNFSIDPQELGLAPGNYTLSVVTDTGEKSVPLEISGTVNNVRIPLEGGAALLNIPGLGEVPYYQISQFGGNADSNKAA
ncbi:Flagellar basal-body rod modification protein FlgD [Paramixta manurensis]|uniref:Basal-body rod modification protein FlgD n=1 Tax=Paramixta manurensis TaxID=2740817 RepID=A0A6M8UFS2_9GAMM|nr:Flagellar basal-body rod modification protein FlgD [Erwiniaceae bacterium PD-1]